MKTNIRLFVPTTTEVLEFEYGLLIHYMTYNESKARSEISLDYYELAAIDPLTNALDIVERKEVTEAVRGQSKIDGFTLDSHYTLSFDQRYNNKTPEQSVRQVWLWLHCNEENDYDFLVEKATDSLVKIPTQNNQLLTRVWAHPDWIERDINPLKQQTVSGRIGLVTLLTQQLAVQFEQIEQENRKKALAEIQAANPQPASVSLPTNSASTAAVVAAPKSSMGDVASNPAPAAVVPPPALPFAATATPLSTQPRTTPVGYPQLIPPPQTPPAKNKTWIWVVVACVIGLPLLLLLGLSGQSEEVQSYDDAAAAAQESVTQAATTDADVYAPDAVADDAPIATDNTTDQAVQDKPPIIVGLQWRSRTINYKNPAASMDIDYQILSNTDGIVLIDKTIVSRPDSQVTLVYDDSLNLIGGKTGRYMPALANYDFPLTEGKTWEVVSEVTDNQYKDLQQASGEVLGRETLSTPMGDVDAIKLVVTHISYLAGVEVGRGQDTSWYVPELGRAVLTEETVWDTETQSWVLDRKHEMTSFTLP